MSDNSQQNMITIDEKTQKELNAPLKSVTQTDPKDKEFLELVIKFINEGKINLYNPSSLLNHGVYDKLDKEKKGKVDMEAFNLLSTVREIKDLYDHGFVDTFQMQNLVSRARNEKERIEGIKGDIFII